MRNSRYRRLNAEEFKDLQRRLYGKDPKKFLHEKDIDEVNKRLARLKKDATKKRTKQSKSVLHRLQKDRAEIIRLLKKKEISLILQEDENWQLGRVRLIVQAIEAELRKQEVVISLTTMFEDVFQKAELEVKELLEPAIPDLARAKNLSRIIIQDLDSINKVLTNSRKQAAGTKLNALLIKLQSSLNAYHHYIQQSIDMFDRLVSREKEVLRHLREQMKRYIHVGYQTEDAHDIEIEIEEASDIIELVDGAKKKLAQGKILTGVKTDIERGQAIFADIVHALQDVHRLQLQDLERRKMINECHVIEKRVKAGFKEIKGINKRVKAELLRSNMYIMTISDHFRIMHEHFADLIERNEALYEKIRDRLREEGELIGDIMVIEEDKAEVHRLRAQKRAIDETSREIALNLDSWRSYKKRAV